MTMLLTFAAVADIPKGLGVFSFPNSFLSYSGVDERGGEELSDVRSFVDRNTFHFDGFLTGIDRGVGRGSGGTGGMRKSFAIGDIGFDALLIARTKSCAPAARSSRVTSRFPPC